MTTRIAIHATVYRAALRFLGHWFDSVRAQSDRDFDVWLSLDGVTEREVFAVIGQPSRVTWRVAPPNATPAAIRQDALAAMLEAYDIIAPADIDDAFLPSRIEGVRAAIAGADLAACALAVMDESGRDVGITFAAPRHPGIDAWLPRWNAFGFSNSAWRSDTLRRCLPIPDDCVLFDWLLATRAWASGARLAFDHTPGMRYRQYAANTAAVLPPFTPDQVGVATRRVLAHYGCVLDRGWPLAEPCRTALADARERCTRFAAAVASPERLAAYVKALNRLHPLYIWWWSVANPELEELWTS